MTAKRRSSSSKPISKSKEMIEESDSSDEDMELEEMEEMLHEGESSEEEDNDDDDDNEDDDDDDEDDDDDDEHGSSEDDEEEVDSEAEESNDEHPDVEGSSIVQSRSGDEKCTLDLRNLLAFNSHQVNYRTLYSQSDKEEESNLTIDVEGSKKANEAHLLQLASEGCTQLLAGLWELETEKTDVGLMAILPSYFETITPRALVSLKHFCQSVPLFPPTCVWLISICISPSFLFTIHHSHHQLQRKKLDGKSLRKNVESARKKNALAKYGMKLHNHGPIAQVFKKPLEMIHYLGQLWKLRRTMIR
jgi:hypothetical protein